MLNELLIAERGAHRAGLKMVERHPDVKDAGGVPTLLVRLEPDGHVASVRPVPREVTPWTLRDGQHNSFPFVQLKPPLWLVPDDDERRRKALDKKSGGRRAVLLALADEVSFNADTFNDWPGDGLLNRLRERRQQLAILEEADAASLPAAFDRFLRACDRSAGGDPERLLRTVTDQLVEGLQQTTHDDWLEVALVLLLGRFNTKESKWKCGGALLFEAAGAQISITDPKMVIRVSEALRDAGSAGAEAPEGVCSLSGAKGRLLSGNFPQPNLPVLGQTYLFAKNEEIPANDRYGRFSTKAMPVTQDIAIRLAAALEALTADDRSGVTWRAVPGEAPKQRDLLLAFVEAAPDAPAAGVLGEDATDDFSAEAPDAAPNTGSVAAFEKRTQRLIEAVRAKIGADFRQTPVHLAVLRKVDPANRKVIYAGAPRVADLHEAATAWSAGERNVPPWLTLPVLRKGESTPRPMAPLHIAPLGVIPFSKQLFIRGGTQQQEVTGVPAGEALALFLDPIEESHGTANRRVRRLLKLVLTRRAALLAGISHVQHTPQCWKGRKDAMKKLDRREALRTVTMLGVLLHKLGRTKEEYMSDTAFQLGQLLAAADVVHAGYCADVRGGDVPASLLGNQVFSIAQTAPVKALAILSRRWKPYDGWAKKAARTRDRAAKLVASNEKVAQQRGWDIRVAIRHAREMGSLADELAASLKHCTVDDTFRAELLLGYIAGLPAARRNGTTAGVIETAAMETEA